MKKLLLIFCVLGMGKMGVAQTNTFPSSGNVGIGTTSPGAPLQVGTPGAGDWHSALFQDGIGIAPSGSRKHVYLYSDNDSIHGINAYDYSSNAYLPTSLGWGGANVFIAQDGGNVGIGTTSPSEKLSVNGKIRAKEIKIETAGWPDFVFEPQYKLRELKETEDFIKQKGHLPEMPSAKEVAENGINLGEMNAKLLQKIEELTLYLIESKNEVQDLQDRIKTLEINNKSLQH